MNEKKECIDLLKQTRRQMITAQAGFPAEKEIYPGWKLKHLLAHIVGWDEATIAALRAHQQGKQPEQLLHQHIDDTNEMLVARRSDLDLSLIRKDWEHVRQELVDLVEALPANTFTQPLRYPWGERGDVQGIISIIAYHEAEHAEDLQKLVGED